MSDLDLIYGTKPNPTPPPAEKATPADLPARKQGGKKAGTRQPSATHARSTGQSTRQSTNQSISQPTGRPITKIVDRPRAFYITERLDDQLDKAVAYLQKTHGIKKVDRSVIVNALLDHDTLWTEEALDQLVERVISQLTNRLISR
jgi:hypothetical protein